MRTATQVGVVLVVLVVLLGSLPGGVAAQTSRVGGAIVVEEGEVIDGDLQAVGGSVVVYGTVNGDVQAAAGDVTVGGDTITLAPTAVVGGDLVYDG